MFLGQEFLGGEKGIWGGGANIKTFVCSVILIVTVNCSVWSAVYTVHTHLGESGELHSAA